MKTTIRILYCLAIFTPVLSFYLYYCEKEDLNFFGFLSFFMVALLFVLSLIASFLIARLVPYHFRPEQEKKRYQTVLNILLLLPPVLFQVNIWGQAIRLTFPVIDDLGGTVLEFLMFPITAWYEAANAVAECIFDTTAVAPLHNEAIMIMAVSYLLLFAVYIIINSTEHIRNNRKEQIP